MCYHPSELLVFPSTCLFIKIVLTHSITITINFTTTIIMDTQDQTSKPASVSGTSAPQSGAPAGSDVKGADGSGGHPIPSTGGEPSTPKTPENRAKKTGEDWIVDDDVDEEDEEDDEDEDDTDDDEDEPGRRGKKEGIEERFNEETKQLLNQFRVLMGTDRMKDFVFACGGSLPIASEQEQDPPQPADTKVSPEQPKSKKRRTSVSSTSTSASNSALLTVSSCKPVTLRWDPSDPTAPASSSKLVFPLEPATSSNLEKLVTNMAPASFGLGGKDVYDETYRKALKLDPTEFSIDFCPYEYGIIDAIAQILLPTLNVKLPTMRGVRAELYKLNVRAVDCMVTSPLADV